MSGQRIGRCRHCGQRCVWSKRLERWLHLRPGEPFRLHEAEVAQT